jgi:hypothetical protein
MPLLRYTPAFLFAVATLFAAAPPAKSPPRLPHPKPVAEAVTKPLVEANNQFALDLYKQLRTTEGNLFFSPHSIASALTLTSAGAAGSTLEQMTRTLHTPRTGAMEMVAALNHDLAARTGKGLVLTSVNRVWVQDGMAVKPEFRTPWTRLRPACARRSSGPTPRSAARWSTCGRRSRRNGTSRNCCPPAA